MPSVGRRVGAVSGRVTSDAGVPLADGVIMIIGDSPVHRDIAALTDGNGRYSFKGLAAGRYTLRAVAPGYSAQVQSTSIMPQRESHLDFVLQREN